MRSVVLYRVRLVPGVDWQERKILHIDEVFGVRERVEGKREKRGGGSTGADVMSK